MRITLSIFILIIFSLQMVSCKKKKADPFSSDYLNMMREGALIEAAFDDVLKISENIMMKNGDARMATTGAPLGCISNIDTVVTGLNQKTYTITFVAGCSDYDGKTRTGSIIIQLNGTSYNAAGSSLTFRFNNYYINSNNLQGKMIVNNEGNGVFKVVVSDESDVGYAVLYIAGIAKNSQWRSTHKRTITAGNGDNIILNNKYHIEAYDVNTTPFAGWTSDTKYYTAHPTTYLLLDYSCNAAGNLRYPTYGNMEYNLEGITRNVDYGDGTGAGTGDSTCNYTVTMNTGDSYNSFFLY
jgi:hypothetical protein